MSLKLRRKLNNRPFVRRLLCTTLVFRGFGHTPRILKRFRPRFRYHRTERSVVPKVRGFDEITTDLYICTLEAARFDPDTVIEQNRARLDGERKTGPEVRRANCCPFKR